MPRYTFVARTRKGQSQKGAVEAANPDEAISILQARDLIVVSVRERAAKETKVSPMTFGGSSHGAVKAAVASAILRSLGHFISAGDLAAHGAGQRCTDGGAL